MTNVIIAGVGGQGVILFSKLLMETAKNAGLDVKESEVHGMAQRGGSVDCNVRFGDKVYSPLIPLRQADYLVALEPLEAIRKLEYLSENGTVISSSQQINPSPVEIGVEKYPEGLTTWIEKNIPHHKIVDPKDVTQKLGSNKPINVVMLGVLSNFLDFELEDWQEAIKNIVKPKFIDLNLKAFQMGRDL